MNKIGFNLLPWTAEVSEKVNPLLDRLKLIGYDGIECLIGSPKESSYLEVGKYAQQIGLEITAVFVFGKENNPVSSEEKIRLSGLDRLKWAIDRCHDLDAKILCGPFHSAHGHFVSRPATSEELKWSAEMLYQSGDYAKDAGVTLALEAVNRFENYLCTTMAQLFDLLELVNHPQVKGMYDTHHANIEEKSVRNSIKTIEKYLAHFHISENDRGTPGIGLVHWEEVFQTLKEINYQGWYTIESFSRADPDFANAINVWREYSDPWEIAEQGYTFIKDNISKY